MIKIFLNHQKNCFLYDQADCFFDREEDCFMNCNKKTGKLYEISVQATVQDKGLRLFLKGVGCKHQ